MAIFNLNHKKSNLMIYHSHIKTMIKPEHKNLVNIRVHLLDDIQ